MEFAPDSQEPEELVAPESEVPESQDEHIAPESQELIAPESEVPESLPPGAFTCPRCHLVHADRQSWNRAHSQRWPCSRCGLIHAEYSLGARIYGLDEFDCEVFIPDLDNVVMDGNTLLIPPHVIKMLDEKRELAAGTDALATGTDALATGNDVLAAGTVSQQIVVVEVVGILHLLEVLPLLAVFIYNWKLV
ncbi:unnamed protein product [Urochloa humidicola]